MFRALEEIEDPGLKQLLAWWREAVTADGLPPHRSAFDPLCFPRLLPHLFMLEALASAHGGFRYRLAGTEVERMFGRALAGLDLFDAPFGEEATSIWNQYQTTLVTSQPTYCEHSFVASHDRFVHYRRLLVPLRRDAAQPDMLLGAVVFVEAFDL